MRSTPREIAEDVADGAGLSLEADEIDVAVLPLGELQVDGVVPDGEAAGEPQDHTGGVAGVDDGVRLLHEVAVEAQRSVEGGAAQPGRGGRAHAAALRTVTMSRSISPRPMS